MIFFSIKIHKIEKNSQGEVFKWLDLSNHPSKTQRRSVYYHM